jgi:hypothetical protein
MLVTIPKTGIVARSLLSTYLVMSRPPQVREIVLIGIQAGPVRERGDSERAG